MYLVPDLELGCYIRRSRYAVHGRVYGGPCELATLLLHGGTGFCFHVASYGTAALRSDPISLPTPAASLTRRHSSAVAKFHVHINPTTTHLNNFGK